MKFNGPAPEIIQVGLPLLHVCVWRIASVLSGDNANMVLEQPLSTVQGRLAMVGFVAGAIRETQTSETLLQQAAHLSPWTGFWLLLIVVASLQPITRAAKSEPFGRLWPRRYVCRLAKHMCNFGISERVLHL